MAASEAMSGYGTIFEVRDGPDTSDAFTELAEVTSITPPSASVDVIDVTHTQSPDSQREFVQGLTDPGECSLGLNFVPNSATTAFILAWRTSRERRDCRITFPDNTTWTFSGFVSGFEPDAPFDDKMSAALTIKVTGPTTVA